MFRNVRKRDLKKFKDLNVSFLSENFPSDNEFQHLKYSENIIEIDLFPCFTNFNKLLQGENSLVYKLHKAQQRLICKLALCFIKTSIIQQ